MKIVQIETRCAPAGSGGSTLIFLHTDDGHTGVGEAPATCHQHTLQAVIDELKSCVVGRDPFDVQAIRATLDSNGNSFDTGVLLSALGGLEIACLDVVGKQLGLPVTQLFGGSLREYVRLCATDWEHSGDTPEDYGLKVHKVAQSGFTAIKFDPFGCIGELFTSGTMLDRAVAITRAVREAVGADVDLIVDAHGRFNPPEAVRVAQALEPFVLMALENPLRTEDLEWWETVSRTVTVPISVGGWFARHHFRDLIERQLTDFVLPHVCGAGGISEVRNTALLAETFFIGFGLHHSGGPLMLAAEAQVGACAPNFTMMEMPYSSAAAWDPILKVPLQVRDGFLKVPSGPGWGIEYLPSSSAG